MTLCYIIIEIPNTPSNLNWNESTDCFAGRQFLEWEPPENLNRFVFSHYEYVYTDGTKSKKIKIFGTRSFLIDRDPSKTYRFEVYAMDKCGIEGRHAQKTILAEENVQKVVM